VSAGEPGINTTQTKTAPECCDRLVRVLLQRLPQIAEPLAASHFATTSSSQTQVFNQFQPGIAAEEAPAP